MEAWRRRRLAEIDSELTRRLEGRDRFLPTSALMLAVCFVVGVVLGLLR